MKKKRNKNNNDDDDVNELESAHSDKWDAGNYYAIWILKMNSKQSIKWADIKRSFRQKLKNKKINKIPHIKEKIADSISSEWTASIQNAACIQTNATIKYALHAPCVPRSVCFIWDPFSKLISIKSKCKKKRNYDYKWEISRWPIE